MHVVTGGRFAWVPETCMAFYGHGGIHGGITFLGILCLVCLLYVHVAAWPYHALAAVSCCLRLDMCVVPLQHICLHVIAPSDFCELSNDCDHLQEAAPPHAHVALAKALC